MSSNTQTTPNGNIVSNITWNHILKCQEGIVTMKDGTTKKVWRGGYEPSGKGWLLTNN